MFFALPTPATVSAMAASIRCSALAEKQKNKSKLLFKFFKKNRYVNVNYETIKFKLLI
jgi:hypothetical protein